MGSDLEGVLVVSLEQAVAAPYVSSRLADAGARVIKLERKEGDFTRRYDSYVGGESAYFVWLNRGKESVIVDIKNPADRDLIERMVAKADVFIQNLAPGAAERAGLGSAVLRERYPRLITCDISGYGSVGPYREMKAYDLLIQAETGLAMLSGTEGQPGRVGVSVCDIACGMNAHQAILQALYARFGTGRGRGIEISLFDSLADWMNVPYLQYRYGKHQPARAGLRHPTIAPYGVFDTASGSRLLISIQNEREWQSLCASVIGQPNLATDSRFVSNTARVANRPELEHIISDVFGALSHEHLVARLQKADIAFGQLRTLSELATHPQLRLAVVETAAGPIELISPPVIERGAAVSLGAVPEIGADDRRVRAEFTENSDLQ